jgi:hypothetical protein
MRYETKPAICSGDYEDIEMKLKSTGERVVVLFQSTSPADAPGPNYLDVLIPCYRRKGGYGRVQRVRKSSLTDK